MHFQPRHPGWTGELCWVPLECVRLDSVRWQPPSFLSAPLERLEMHPVGFLLLPSGFPTAHLLRSLWSTRELSGRGYPWPMTWCEKPASSISLESQQKCHLLFPRASVSSVTRTQEVGKRCNSISSASE